MPADEITTVDNASERVSFDEVAHGIIGNDLLVQTPQGNRKMIYADWIASGRLYAPIERAMNEKFGPLVGNTHSEASLVGEAMTHAYKKAQQIIKKHVHAGEDDVLISCGSGMTGAIAKLQRILGLNVPDKAKRFYHPPKEDRPVVFLTHMEHHSNQTSWLECEVDAVLLPPDNNMLVNPESLELEIMKYKDRKIKIGSFTACSNVTGIFTEYHKLASIMHHYGGWCFVDFAASAPYADMDMHPENLDEHLDAIFFSPHKFLGGPGSSGILIFNNKLYSNQVPDQPGGGTVLWTNPWGEHNYIEDIEAREDGGTPAFLQTIRAALAVKLKEEMGTANIARREEELLDIVFHRLSKVSGLHILAPGPQKRLGVVSFYVDDLHYNLIVRALSDYFGIQVRGGCSCAGTYGHFLLNVSQETSREISERIDSGDLSAKPGWVRLSLHPVMTDEEVLYICDAIEEVASKPEEWKTRYRYSAETNEFYPFTSVQTPLDHLDEWFNPRMLRFHDMHNEIDTFQYRLRL